MLWGIPEDIGVLAEDNDQEDGIALQMAESNFFFRGPGGYKVSL